MIDLSKTIQENAAASLRKESNVQSSGRFPKVMLFDLEYTGHHANYIRYLIRYWGDHQLAGELIILVSPVFKQKHENVVELADSYLESEIRMIAVSEVEAQSVSASKTTVDRSLRQIKEWGLLCKYASSLRVDHCIIMYIDTCELPFILGLKAPCSISGIYFRPSFHYASFSDISSRKWNTPLRSLREQTFIRRLTQSKLVSKVFCIDPFASAAINEKFSTSKAVHLADPVEIPGIQTSRIETISDKLKIEKGRKTFLLFGSINARKGVYKTLDALSQLSDDSCRQICLLIVGAPRASELEMLNYRIDEVTAQKPIQVLTVFEYISEADVPVYFRLSDFVLAPYQSHIGMSGILLLAAASDKPVISSDFGLMGKLVRQFELGVSINSSSTDAIRDAISCLLSSCGMSVHSTKKSRLFAEMNSAERFSETIFEHICPNISISRN